jgi:eukaryotic-like serine/threonine-protein kinase
MGASPGEKLGPYEIVSLIGSGGMGEVYRAHDPRMGRDVALKLSAQQFSERFEREVRAVAALSHPNICTIHDVGLNYFVMELVDGPTLAERIKQGPIPLDEALGIARQIADALEAAHEKGIIHRDLKPGNIKLTPDGTVKILDFGLAKMGSTPESSATTSPDARTVTMGATQAGTLLGTPAYMSPEQARGKTVDRRADTWAFGVVLYEMLTGQQTFSGESLTDVLASVIQREPDWTRVPETVRPLLGWCLEKDPKRRLREPADGWLLLESNRQPVRAAVSNRLGPISTGAAAVFLLAFAVLAFIHFREKPRAGETVRLQLSLPPNVTFSQSGIFAISPDGSKLAFSAFGSDGAPRIWIRDLASWTAQPLANLETPQGLHALFWSPDSRFLAVQSEGKLKKVDIVGGAAQEICDAPGGVFGGSWSRDDVILFAGNQGGGIVRVPASGGTPVPVATEAKGENFLPIYPVFLPDGRHFLYSRGAGQTQRGIYLGSLETKPEQQNRTALVKTDYSFAYVPTSGRAGYLLFLNRGALFAQRFDTTRMALTGDPVVVADPVAAADSPALGYFSASENGSLVYLTAPSRNLQLTWFNRQGEVVGKPAVSGEFNILKLSPDGAKAAVVETQVFTGQSSIWLIDLIQGTNNRFTFGSGFDSYPVWSPDGSRIAWLSTRGGKAGIYQKAANGAGSEELLYEKAGSAPRLSDWSHDGRFLVYTLDQNLWALPVGPGTSSDRKPVALVVCWACPAAWR